MPQSTHRRENQDLDDAQFELRMETFEGFLTLILDICTLAGCTFLYYQFVQISNMPSWFEGVYYGPLGIMLTTLIVLAVLAVGVRSLIHATLKKLILRQYRHHATKKHEAARSAKVTGQ